MDIDLRLLDPGRGLYKRHDLILNRARDGDDIAAIQHIDDDVDNDLFIDELNLDALGHGLEADQLGKLRPCGVGKTGDALHLTD